MTYRSSLQFRSLARISYSLILANPIVMIIIVCLYVETFVNSRYFRLYIFSHIGTIIRKSFNQSVFCSPMPWGEFLEDRRWSSMWMRWKVNHPGGGQTSTATTYTTSSHSFTSTSSSTMIRTNSQQRYAEVGSRKPGT